MSQIHETNLGRDRAIGGGPPNPGASLVMRVEQLGSMNEE